MATSPHGEGRGEEGQGILDLLQVSLLEGAGPLLVREGGVGHAAGAEVQAGVRVLGRLISMRSKL